MRRYVEAMRPGSFEASVCSSILALRAEMLDRAQAHVEAARRAVDAELTALVEESYERAYPIMVRLQQLAELEALLRVLGADGARCLDAAFTRAAVDEMARFVRGVLVYVIVNSVASMARNLYAIEQTQRRRDVITRAGARPPWPRSSSGRSSSGSAKAV